MLASDSALVFAAVAATLYAAHQVADHVFGQTDYQASHKAEGTRTGWLCLLGHIGLYHLVMAGMLAVTTIALHLPVTLTGAVVGLLVSTTTHTLLDRRWPVRWLLEHTGSTPFSRMAGHGINGMYLADQALHYGCLWMAALLTACL